MFPPSPHRGATAPAKSLYAGSEQYDHVSLIIENVVWWCDRWLADREDETVSDACASSTTPLASHGVDIAVMMRMMMMMMIGVLLFVPLLQGSLNSCRLGPRR